ncbi:hypothetical protein [Robertkochia aurantiaca]|uniref:hypothetical protein n=1 Tax=Robertkochia aurantiaca TaxID=2873700 RepID=UPI001CCE109F|nr:hypothetical protein [Robertkochia sp. 3YJGBD-33]
MKKIIEEINSYEITVVVVIITIIGLTYWTMSAPGINAAAQAGFINLLSPTFFGILTLIAYFISFKYTVKYRWVITLLGTAINFYYAYQIYTGII